MTAPWHPLPSLEPPVDKTNPSATSRFVDANGITVHVAEAGSGPPLVLLHALGWDHRQWEHHFAHYAQHYHVLAIDVRGHGKTTVAPGPYSLELFRDDLLATFDALGIASTAVVGFSLGGMIAQYVAAIAPERVAALALISTVCRTDPALREVMEERIAANQAKGARAAAETVAKTLFSGPFREAEPEFLEKFYAWRVASPQDPIFDSMRATFALDICHALPRFRMPCMVVAGATDAANTPKNVARLADDIPGATFQTIADSGHLIPIEQPVAFRSCLDTFLSQHYPAARDYGLLEIQ